MDVVNQVIDDLKRARNPAEVDFFPFVGRKTALFSPTKLGIL